MIAEQGRSDRWSLPKQKQCAPEFSEAVGGRFVDLINAASDDDRLCAYRALRDGRGQGGSL